jgi:hypothetical protein
MPKNISRQFALTGVLAVKRGALNRDLSSEREENRGFLL